jgi:MarR family transcriptional regulator, organic hydroperoxide resistance regulator
MTSSFPEYVVDIEQRLRQIAVVVRRRGRMLLDGYGITPPQLDALVTLQRDGELTIGDLSSRLYLAYSTTTDLVDRLERAGFVERYRDTEDRRVVRVRLQEYGSTLIEEVLNARRAYLADVLSSVDLNVKRSVLEVLDMLNVKMNEK